MSDTTALITMEFPTFACCQHCICPPDRKNQHYVKCHMCEVAEGQAEKEKGMARALSPDPLALWKERFRAAVRLFAQRGQSFTSEDVVDYVGLPSGGTGMNANNAVGAMMNALAKQGVIRKTERREPSRRKTSHGAELVVWTGV